MTNEESNIIETPDLYFAAFLQTKDLEIVETKKQGNKIVFYFKVPKDVDYRKAYFNQNDEVGSVPACKYANTIKNLKTMCYIKDGH
jgi:hypothetical protein